MRELTDSGYPLVSASILNADLTDLKALAALVKSSGADAIHYDVMDGCFVDNISFGLPVLQNLLGCSELPADVHLMIQDPLRFISRFAMEGVKWISFHAESASPADKTISAIHAAGISAGIALSPGTPVETVFPYLPLLNRGDFVLIMTVEPGWGNQAFIESTLEKIKVLHERFQTYGLPLHIQVDGGINDVTAPVCREAGADFIVSGSYLLKAADKQQACVLLRG